MEISKLFLNALYLRLYRENKTDLFLEMSTGSKNYVTLDKFDMAIAEFMSEREKEMDDLPHYWNEDGYIDYESAYATLIEIADNIKKHLPKMSFVNFKDCLVDGVRWCSYCGKPFTEGFYLTNFYACSDECRNEHYKQGYEAKDDEEAHKMFLLECYEIAGDKYPNLCSGNLDTVNAIKEQTGKHPQDLTLKELEQVVDENSFEIGDYAYYTNWH